MAGKGWPLGMSADAVLVQKDSVQIKHISSDKTPGSLHLQALRMPPTAGGHWVFLGLVELKGGHEGGPNPMGLCPYKRGHLETQTHKEER